MSLKSLPQKIIFSTCIPGTVKLSSLHPSEQALVADSVPQRQLLFSAGRSAAHAALRTLDSQSSTPILAGSQGEPLWPPGIVGSIAHCEGLAIALVANEPQILALGVDVERADRTISERALKRIATASELGAVQKQLDSCPTAALKLFSAKESALKAGYSVFGRLPGYDSIEVEFNARAQTLTAQVMNQHSPAHSLALAGGWELLSGFLVTYVYAFGA